MLARTHGNRQKHESTNPIQRALIGHFHQQLARAIEALGPKSILEVGCGEGYVLGALRAQGVRASLEGIDLSEPAIEEAKQRVPDASFRVHDALELANQGRRYDAVLMIEVLEHLAEPEKMLPILESLSQRYVILSVPWEPFFRGLNFMRGKNLRAFGNDPEHLQHWSRSAFLRFASARFRVRAAPLVFPWTLVVAERLTPA